MTDATTTWQLDPSHTGVEFAVKHMMFSTVRGRFADVRGTLELNEAEPSAARVDVTIAAASIDTGVADRDKHLRSGDFLEVEAFPKITFRSTRVEGLELRAGAPFQVVGDLSIRGEAVEVVLDARFEGTGQDPWGGTRVGFQATTTIDRRDWGLKWNQALEAGGILVGHELRISLDVQAVKQAGAERAA